jgi:hypothetical protein
MLYFSKEPVYVLFFEESHYAAGHYQALMCNSSSKVLDHYLWSMNKEGSRLRAVSTSTTMPGSPAFSSSKRNDSVFNKSRSRARLASTTETGNK